MAKFDCLPYDVIYHIFNFEVMSFVDICRLSLVSKLFNCVAKSNMLWRKKYKQMWPDLISLFNAPNVDWRIEFQKRYTFKRLIAKRLRDLSAEYYHLDNVTNEAFLFFIDISQDHEFGYQLIINELEHVVDDQNDYLNLTLKYYAVRALRYMRHAHLEGVWRDYLSQPSNKVSLLEGACLISQWCQPSVSKCTSNVSVHVDNITQQVLAKVQKVFPQHPLVKHGLFTSDEVLPKSLWSPLQCRSILYCLNEILFDELQFNCCNFDCSSADTSFIDKVLIRKEGISITIGILYAVVAEKLGVKCLSVNFPGHFLLKWLEHPHLTDERKAYTFIDITEKGAFKKIDELQDLVPGYHTFNCDWADAVSPINVLVRMAWYLVEFGRQVEGAGEDSMCLCNSLELLCLLSPEDIEHKLLLARLFMHLGINVTKAISLLQEIAAYDPLNPLAAGYMYQSTLHTLETQKFRRPLLKLKCQIRDESSDVKFAVGMIMKHTKYHYRCVIYGWDYKCSAGLDWIKRMGVNSLINKDKQPYYYVLVEDGTNRYAAQENLEIDKESKPINHIKIGRYFESYHGYYYLPNEQTILEYPHDITAREKFLHQYEELASQESV